MTVNSSGGRVEREPRAISGTEEDDGAEPSERAAGSKRDEQADHSRAGSTLSAGLYIVATPIGHARDVTLRALEILAAVDVIACEDTRVTAKLLARHGIAARTLAYHEHNAARMRPQLLARLRRGERIALVSDAGTPLISDPGYELVEACIAAGIAVTTAPGPSAALAALVLSGLPTDRFLVAGFLPNRSAQRRTTLAELAAVPATLVLFEAPQRLADSLTDMSEILGARPAAIARELTKRFEEVRRGDLSGLANHYRAADPPLGEIVVVVGPPGAAAKGASAEDLDRQLDLALATMSLRDAAEAVARATGVKRRAVYARALERQARGAERKPAGSAE